MNPKREKKLRVTPFAVHATRGLIREQGARRKVMLAVLLGALVMMVLGSTLLHGVLDHREHPGWFIAYWCACAWLTVLALLLAIFDMLLLRAQARAARKLLLGQIARTATPDSPSDERDG